MIEMERRREEKAEVKVDVGENLVNIDEINNRYVKAYRKHVNENFKYDRKVIRK